MQRTFMCMVEGCPAIARGGRKFRVPGEEKLAEIMRSFSLKDKERLELYEQLYNKGHRDLYICMGHYRERAADDATIDARDATYKPRETTTSSKRPRATAAGSSQSKRVRAPLPLPSLRRTSAAGVLQLQPNQPRQNTVTFPGDWLRTQQGDMYNMYTYNDVDDMQSVAQSHAWVIPLNTINIDACRALCACALTTPHHVLFEQPHHCFGFGRIIVECATCKRKDTVIGNVAHGDPYRSLLATAPFIAGTTLEAMKRVWAWIGVQGPGQQAIATGQSKLMGIVEKSVAKSTLAATQTIVDEARAFFAKNPTGTFTFNIASDLTVSLTGSGAGNNCAKLGAVVLMRILDYRERAESMERYFKENGKVLAFAVMDRSGQKVSASGMEVPLTETCAQQFMHYLRSCGWEKHWQANMYWSHDNSRQTANVALKVLKCHVDMFKWKMVVEEQLDQGHVKIHLFPYFSPHTTIFNKYVKRKKLNPPDTLRGLKNAKARVVLVEVISGVIGACTIRSAALHENGEQAWQRVLANVQGHLCGKHSDLCLHQRHKDDDCTPPALFKHAFGTARWLTDAEAEYVVAVLTIVVQPKMAKLRRNIRTVAVEQFNAERLVWTQKVFQRLLRWALGISLAVLTRNDRTMLFLDDLQKQLPAVGAHGAVPFATLKKLTESWYRRITRRRPKTLEESNEQAQKRAERRVAVKLDRLDGALRTRKRHAAAAKKKAALKRAGELVPMPTIVEFLVRIAGASAKSEVVLKSEVEDVVLSEISRSAAHWGMAKGTHVARHQLMGIAAQLLTDGGMEALRSDEQLHATGASAKASPSAGTLPSMDVTALRKRLTLIIVSCAREWVRPLGVRAVNLGAITPESVRPMALTKRGELTVLTPVRGDEDDDGVAMATMLAAAVGMHDVDVAVDTSDGEASTSAAGPSIAETSSGDQHVEDSDDDEHGDPTEQFLRDLEFVDDSDDEDWEE